MLMESWFNFRYCKSACKKGSDLTFLTTCDIEHTSYWFDDLKVNEMYRLIYDLLA